MLLVILQLFQRVSPLFLIGHGSKTLLKCHTCSGYDLDHCQERICQGRMNICFYEEVKHNAGKTYYLAGCALDSTCPANNPIVYSTGADGGKICRQCCRSNYCNMRNCDPLAANKPTPGYNDRRCFSCDGENNVQSCSRTDICKQGEHCYLQVHANGDHLSYHGGCVPSTNCTTSHLPNRSGQDVCSQCCTQDYCNSDICLTKVGEYLKSLNEGGRECYQCYDQRLDDISRCVQKVTCSSSTSKCSSIMRNESGILTVDLDCEESLPCSSLHGNEVCGQCCNWNSCNKDIDCRYPIQLTTAPTGVSTVDTTVVIPTVTAVPTPYRECFQCSDLRLTSRGHLQTCGKTTICASKCASVYREEDGIISVDLGCEKHLSCDVKGTDGRLCTSCCDTDRCNDFDDCATHVAESKSVRRHGFRDLHEWLTA